ncbi:MAG: hypothetical protein IPP29_08145 [Bacteroidetes bacterium]|nr:hypothetical protein [Bacteroidota bacterium]
MRFGGVLFLLGFGQHFALSDSGNFFFRVQACCPAVEGKANHVEVRFYLMPLPNINCDTLTYVATHDTAPTPAKIDTNFIPLSSVMHDINILCPGCVVPGAIAATSFMVRKSLGLQDANNNGFADNGLIKITDTSAWYNNFKPLLQTNFSTYGDSVADYVTIYFQDGDAGGGGGYTYAQMLNNDAKFHFIQVSKNLLKNSAKMGLIPTGITFYVDTNINTSNCYNCGEFKVDTTWSTMAQVTVGVNDLPNYIVQDTDNFLFSFSDTAADVTYINNANNTYTDSIYPFTSINANQRYRLKVNYIECKTFDAINKGSTQTAVDVT